MTKKESAVRVLKEDVEALQGTYSLSAADIARAIGYRSSSSLYMALKGEGSDSTIKAHCRGVSSLLASLAGGEDMETASRDATAAAGRPRPISPGEPPSRRRARKEEPAPEQAPPTAGTGPRTSDNGRAGGRVGVAGVPSVLEGLKEAYLLIHSAEAIVRELVEAGVAPMLVRPGLKILLNRLGEDKEMCRVE